MSTEKRTGSTIKRDLTQTTGVKMSNLQERTTYHSGEWIPESKASIHIYDSQFMFGDGVFEMIRTFNQKFFLAEEHIDRLFRNTNHKNKTRSYGFVRRGF